MNILNLIDTKLRLKKNVITIYPVLKNEKDFKCYASSNGIEDILRLFINLTSQLKKLSLNVNIIMYLI